MTQASYCQLSVLGRDRVFKPCVAILVLVSRHVWSGPSEARMTGAQRAQPTRERERPVATDCSSLLYSDIILMSRQSSRQGQKPSCLDRTFHVSKKLARPGIFCRDTIF